MSLATTIKNKPKTQLPSHVIVAALAGTGKTTTLIEGLKKLRGYDTSVKPSPQQQKVWDAIGESRESAHSVCFVAFNKAIATELQRRVPVGVNAMTMHSMGLKATTAAFGKVQIDQYRVSNIISDITGKDIRDLRKDDFELVNATEKLVSLCKMNLVSGSDAEELAALAAYYDIDMNGSSEKVFELVPKVIERCKDVNRDRQIDFNDMIWLPVVLNLPVTKYDLLLVDECQDLNRCQQALAKAAGRRLVLCGDVHQAIYGFAGADAESVDRMREELEATEQGCVVLPLTVTRRCGKAIVEEAKKIVPAFEAHESNGEGKVSRAIYENKVNPDDTYRAIVKVGDMLICRVNAPLVGQCFRFLKAGIRAEIQGRDIGQGLISTIKKMKADTVPELVQKLSDWEYREREKELKKRNPNDQRLIALTDRYDCLINFTSGASTIDEILKRIESIFTDNKDGSCVRLSSIHKAKGLEAKRVFLLEPEGATVPHPMAKTKWQRTQEMNLRYVAITRAIEELVYVS